MNTAIFLLRVVQVGISISDLDLLTIGMINDMYIEAENDQSDDYLELASQEDFDSFGRMHK